jgi:hypothetical protein
MLSQLKCRNAFQAQHFGMKRYKGLPGTGLRQKPATMPRQAVLTGFGEWPQAL